MTLPNTGTNPHYIISKTSLLILIRNVESVVYPVLTGLNSPPVYIKYQPSLLLPAKPEEFRSTSVLR